MKNGLKDIIGKRIAAVVVAKGAQPPRNQVFLVFADGTRFEFHGDTFTCGTGLDEAAGIVEQVESRGGEITRVFGLAPILERAPVAASASMEALMSRDLAAWQAAKSAIQRARRA